MLTDCCHGFGCGMMMMTDIFWGEGGVKRYIGLQKHNQIGSVATSEKCERQMTGALALLLQLI